VDEVAGGRVEHHELDGPAHVPFQLRLEVEEEPLEDRRGLAPEQHAHVHIASRGGGASGHAAEEVDGRHVVATGLEEPPEPLLDLGLRLGPHKLSLAKLRAAEHGLDLGALEPRFPDRLCTRDKRIDLAPAIYLADLRRLDQLRATTELVMIGRRQLRSNNSWMHNSERLVKGPARCTLLIHPDDATPRGLRDGATARVSTRVGSIELPVEVSDAMMPGVVSIPHGWGHHRVGTRLRVASKQPGVSMNDIIDPQRIDRLSGTSALSGQPVEVEVVSERSAAGATTEGG